MSFKTSKVLGKLCETLFWKQLSKKMQHNFSLRDVNKMNVAWAVRSEPLKTFHPSKNPNPEFCGGTQGLQLRYSLVDSKTL